MDRSKGPVINYGKGGATKRDKVGESISIYPYNKRGKRNPF